MESNDFGWRPTDAEPRTIDSSEVDEVDNLSTNVNKQMDRQTEEEEDEETASNSSIEELPQMNAELETGCKILKDLMADSKKAVNWPFMESIQDSAPDLYNEYSNRIEKPMWLKLMKKKFDERAYSSITEFVSDFRLMLENCYRFNGPDHYVSKRGQKLETMLEQKLALLSRELREKTSIEATSGVKSMDSKHKFSPGGGMRRRHKTLIPHDSTNLLNQLREQEQQKVREWRKQQIIDRKAEKEALAQEILDWEDTVLFCGKYKEHMKAMWELPQIGLFLFLCQVPLNIGEVMHFELERCFLIPRESSTMQLVMTSLLSTPFQRLKLDKKSLMPYKVWEFKLRIKLQQWYKVFTDNDFDAEKTWLKLGVEGTFFEAVGRKNPLEKKKFHQLPFYKRVWVVKSLCDYCLQTQDSIRETIELQPYPDQREYVLGTDAEGKRYIHFPQFCGADVRVYRQAPVKYPKIEIKPDSFDSKRKFPLVYKPPPSKKIRLQNKKKKVKKPEKPSPQPSPSRQRPSRLRQSVKPVIPLQIGDSAESTDSEDRTDNSEDESDNHQMEIDETGDNDSIFDNNAESKSGEGEKNDLNDTDDDADEDKSLDDNDRLSSGSDVTIAYCDNSDTNSSFSSRDCSRETSPFMSTDLRLRRSARLDKFSDISREASPLIYDSDFGMSRSGRGRIKTKTPSYKASRNLTSLLVDENSTTSNSSAFGEPSISGILSARLLNNANLNSNSSETGEESNDCDIPKLFSNAGNEDTNSSSSVIDQSKVPCESADNDKDDCNIGASKRLTSDLINLSKSDTSRSINRESDDVITAQEISDHNTVTLKAFSDVEGASITNKQSEVCDTSGLVSTVNIPNGDLPLDESIVGNACNKDRSDCFAVRKDVCMDEGENECALGGLENGEECTEIKLVKSSYTGKLVLGTNSADSPLSVDTLLVNDKPVDSAGDHRGKMEATIEDCGTQGLEGNNVDKERIECQSLENTHDSSNDKDNKLSDIVTTEDNSKINKRDTNGVFGGDATNEDNFRSECKVNIDKIKHEPSDDGYLDNNAESCSTQIGSSEIKTEPSFGTESKQTVCQDKTFDSIKAEDAADVKMEIDENVKERQENNNYVSDIKAEPQSESEEEEEDEMVPDINDFELLADSVEDLRNLTMQFEEPEPIIIKKGKKEIITRPPPRKKCVVHLHERLQFLLKELEPWESRLVQATKRARMRIRKEVEDYFEPPETEDSHWNTTDEETESGGSEDETDKQGKRDDDSKDGSDVTGKYRSNLLTGKTSRENMSGASTPVKLEDQDEIDISQRGRLRKRRIIPNNAEDQIAPKKAKPKTEPCTIQDMPTPSQPIIIQSGKSQLVDYSDILRQLKNVNSKGTLPPGVNPVLIKTTQGGRTLLTSVMPVNTSVSNSGSVTQKLQNIRLISPLALQQHLAGQNVQLSLPVMGSSSSSTKISQHPTIQHLLTGNTSTAPSGVKNLTNVSSSGSLVQVLPQKSAQNETVILQSTKSGETAMLTPVKAEYPASAMITPEKSGNQDQVTPQKFILNQNLTPRKIAPYPIGGATGQTVKGTVKYYAANASTLPINVVQQLLATRGAKLQTGPNQQSILYIPMENDGETRNVVPLQGKYVSGIPQTQSKSTVVDSQAKMSTTVLSSQGSGKVTSHTNIVSSSKNKSPVTSNMLILPKPQPVPSTSPVFNVSVPSGYVAMPVQQGSRSVSPNQSTSVGISKTVKTIIQSRLAAGGIALNPTSPPRYPTNETVRTLLDKRKSVDDKTLDKALKSAVETKLTAYTCIASQLQRPCPSSMASSVILKKIAASADPNTPSVSTVGGTPIKGYITATKDSTQSENVVKTTAVQQHVLTSISPAKLNTLLLQTSAAGAKSIPSLIKLPSKAVLDSAVKAVVTSVNTSLPTVNIKVPSPKSLPYIEPRRNVTKTIQTMKSPIPVAPRVVTQNSGRTFLSVGDSSCLSSTQSIVSTPSIMGNSTQMPVQTNTTVPQMHAQVQTQVATIVQGADGKRVLTKLPSQNTQTSDQVMQMGYLTPQGYVIPKLQQNPGNQSATAILNQLGLQSQVKQEMTGSQSPTPGMQLVQNVEGLLQLVPKSSLQTPVPTSKATILQLGNQANATLVAAHQAKKGILNKQVVAINAQGKHIIVKQKIQPNQQAQVSPSDPTAIQPKSSLELLSPPLLQTIAAQSPDVSIASAIRPGVISPNMELTSSGANYLLPQTVPRVLNRVQSPASTQPTFSPLLNMQQVMLPGAGFQLSSPVVNPGVNLLQSSLPLHSPTMMQSSQNVNIQGPGLMQSSQSMNVQMPLNSPSVQQVVNINQNLLNKALLTNIGHHQLKVSPALNVSSQSGGPTPRPVLLPSPSFVNQSTLLHKETNDDHSKEYVSKSVQSREPVQFTFRQNQHVKPSDPSKGSVFVAAGVTLTSSNSVNSLPSASAPTKQMVIQYAIPSQGIVSPSFKQSLASQSLTATTASHITSHHGDRITPKQMFNPHMDRNLILSQAARTIPDSSAKALHLETHPSKLGADVACLNNTKQADQSATLKTNQTNQKLLLYSIGGQLVTGQGVPVTLHQGVLKVMPQGKLQIANQTLTPEQIKQTLAKIGNATVNAEPSAQQSSLAATSGIIRSSPTNESKSMSGTPTQTMYHHDKPFIPASTLLTNASAMDHAYQHKQRVVGNMAARVKRISSSGSETDMKQEPDSDTVKPDILRGAKSNSAYVMKPLTYSPGYTVFPSAIKSEDLQSANSVPVVRAMNLAPKSGHNQLQSIVKKSPVNFGINGGDKNTVRDEGRSTMVVSNRPGVKANSLKPGNCNNGDDVDEEEDDNHLIIDDSASEKEAALNLLTLANQAFK